MTAAGAYFDLLDLLDSREILDPTAFLSLIQRAYGTGPVTYLEGDVIDGRLQARSLHFSHRTNANAFRRSLHRKAAVEQILRVLVALEPIAFSGWQKSGNHDQHLIGYPLPGRHSCLLVDLGSVPSEIGAWRRAHDRDLLSLGAKLNARLASAATDGPQKRIPSTPLTRRERETLAWIAAGKSYWETAVILGISERTIRHFMANARQKLDVVTNAQAVAEAVWRGLIPRLAEAQAS